MKIMIQRFFFRAASALLCIFALSSCWNAEEIDFTNFVEINDIRNTIIDVKYKSATVDGLSLILDAGELKLTVTVSDSQIGKVIDLATFQSDASNYWVIKTGDGEADSRTTRSDRGKMRLNRSDNKGEPVFTLEMDVILGYGYSIVANYAGTATNADKQDIIDQDD